MSVEPVAIGEFNRAVGALSAQLATVQATAQATLIQATKTNGRVDALEELTRRHAVKLETPLSADATPLTKRDLWVVVGTLGALGGLVTFLLTLWAARAV